MNYLMLDDLRSATLDYFEDAHTLFIAKCTSFNIIRVCSLSQIPDTTYTF